MTSRSRTLWPIAALLGVAAAGTALSKRRSRAGLPHASALDTLAFAADVFLPVFAKGVIVRRPWVEGMWARTGVEDRGVRRMQRLRDKYGDGPLVLGLPVRRQAVVLSPGDVHRVLRESPQPFSTASSEKRAALGHLEPKGALVSDGAERADRRRFNEEVLDHGHCVHGMADALLPIVREEAAAIRRVARQRGVLDWEAFSQGWFRMVRRVVFGDAAREDHALSEMTYGLRKAANWAFLRPRRTVLRERFFDRIGKYLDLAEPGSLAARAAQVRKTPTTEPHQQVAQWLFAFDPAGMATFRALALLAAHPEQGRAARDEALAGDPRQLPLLRAAVLEALRLWPTTPMILRQTTDATHWEAGAMSRRSGVLIYVPFFHRDETRLPFAHRFTPDLWLRERGDADWPLVPFSGGPAICPARHLVQMLASAMLAALIDQQVPLLVQPRALDTARLPATLDHFTLRFRYP